MSKKTSTKQTKARRTDKSLLRDETIEESSGNVFADLGLPNAEALLLKAELSLKLRELVEQKGWTESETSRLLGIRQAAVSNLLRGRFPRLSVERLLTIVNQLTV